MPNGTTPAPTRQVDPSINQLKKKVPRNPLTFYCSIGLGRTSPSQFQILQRAVFILIDILDCHTCENGEKCPQNLSLFAVLQHKKAKIAYKTIKQNVFVFKNCIFRGVGHFFSPKNTRHMIYFYA